MKTKTAAPPGSHLDHRHLGYVSSGEQFPDQPTHYEPVSKQPPMAPKSQILLGILILIFIFGIAAVIFYAPGG